MLTPWEDAIRDGIERARLRAAGCVELPVLDLVVQAVKDGGIPELGHVGHAPRPGAIFITLDPDNPNLVRHMGEAFERMVVHELHHALRWDAVGYGRTLGEAIVSEGLAGRFVQELFGGEGEPWDRALTEEQFAALLPRLRQELKAERYNHAAWFFGRGDLPVGPATASRGGSWASISLARLSAGHRAWRACSLQKSSRCWITRVVC
jgi:Predicted Zn-dependent protease (DUF2268)